MQMRMKEPLQVMSPERMEIFKQLASLHPSENGALTPEQQNLKERLFKQDEILLKQEL